MRRFIPSLCLLLLLTTMAGCGSKKVSISGTVTRTGEKMTWPNGGTLLVIFFPEDRKRDEMVYRAETDTATSTYKIGAIPTGKYTVAIQQFDTKHMDSLSAKYDPSKTTLRYEVTQDGQVIDIELPDAPSKEANDPKEPKEPKEPRGKKKDGGKEKE